MGGEIIGEIFDNYGISGIIAFIVALISFAIFVKYITSLTFNFPSLGYKKLNSMDLTLKEHLFFTSAKFKLRFDIPTLELCPNHPVAQRVFIDLVYMNVESFYYGCRRITEIHDLKDLDGQEWGNMVKSELKRMLHSYEDRAEDMGVPKLVIHKYARWLGTYMELLNTYINQLSGSTIYGDSTLRTNVFLLIMNLLIVTIIGDLDKLVRESLPDISGIEYKGSFIEHSKPTDLA